MEHSESITELAKAMSKFQGALSPAKKDSVNPFFKMRYASLDAVWEVCRKPLTDNGLCLIQSPVELNGKICLETMLIHASGEWMLSLLPLNDQRYDGNGVALPVTPQSVGAAITYARRYAMSAMLGISVDEDDDAEGTMGRVQTAEEKQATRKEHWCKKHNCEFFRRGKMKSYAHPIGETGEWCHEPTSGNAPEAPKTGVKAPDPSPATTQVKTGAASATDPEVPDSVFVTPDSIVGPILHPQEVDWGELVSKGLGKGHEHTAPRIDWSVVARYAAKMGVPLSDIYTKALGLASPNANLWTGTQEDALGIIEAYARTQGYAGTKWRQIKV